MARIAHLLNRANVQIIVELLLLWGVLTLGYLYFLEPLLQAVAPTIYVESGLDYGRYAAPDTPTELTHLTLTVIGGLSFYYWRLNYTELGAKVQAAEDKFAGKDR